MISLAGRAPGPVDRLPERLGALAEQAGDDLGRRAKAGDARRAEDGEARGVAAGVGAGAGGEHDARDAGDADRRRADPARLGAGIQGAVGEVLPAERLTGPA